MTATRLDSLRKSLDDYDAAPDGPLGDLMADMRVQANRLGYRANTCGSVIAWSRRYLARNSGAPK